MVLDSEYFVFISKPKRQQNIQEKEKYKNVSWSQVISELLNLSPTITKQQINLFDYSQLVQVKIRRHKI